MENVPSTSHHCDKVVFFLVLTHHEVYCGRNGMEKIIDQGSNLDRGVFPVLDLDHVDDSLKIVLEQKITKYTQTLHVYVIDKCLSDYFFCIKRISSVVDLHRQISDFLGQIHFHAVFGKIWLNNGWHPHL